MNRSDYKINDVNFNLKHPNSNKETVIYAFLMLPDKRLKVSTGIKIHPKYWDAKRKKIKRHKQQIKLNNRLENIHIQLKEIVINLINTNRKITASKVKDLFLGNYDEVSEKNDLILPNFELFIKNYRYQGRKPGNKRIQRYYTVFNRIKEFEEKNNIKLTFDDIDKDFFNRFTEFNYKKNLTDNTISTYIKILKTFMNWAFENEDHDNLAYKKFPNLERDADTISLSQEEVRKIEELDLSENKALNRAKDHFLMQIYSGMRFSDLVKLKASYINWEGKYIKFTTEKTSEIVIIPLSKKLEKIIKKYPYFNFRFNTNQQQNQQIKTICKLAEIDQPVALTKIRQGRTEEEVKPKYNFITTHTARRSFITLSLAKNINPEIIKKASGHKDSRSFNKYIRLNAKQVVDSYDDMFE